MHNRSPDAPLLRVLDKKRWIELGLDPKTHTRVYNVFRINKMKRVKDQRRHTIREWTVRDVQVSPDFLLLQLQYMGTISLHALRDYLEAEFPEDRVRH